MNLSIKDPLEQPCPPTWTPPLPPHKRQKQHSPLTPAPRCVCSPRVMGDQPLLPLQGQIQTFHT